MIFALCLFHFFTFQVIFASNGSRGFLNIFKCKKAEIPSIPNEPIEVEPLANEVVLDLRPSSPTYFDYLGYDVNRSIFEDLIMEDFASIRLVSKGFRKSFDDLIYALCCDLIPGFTKSTFSHWNDNDPTKEYLKYQLIVLVRAILPDYKPMRMKYLKSGIGMHLKTDFYLRRNAVKMIQFFGRRNVDMSLKLANALLKLRIVDWGDIYHLLFSNSKDNISKAWELGLITIAHEMAFYHQKEFLQSLKQETGNLYRVARAQNFVLFRFMIATARSQNFFLGCLQEPVFRLRDSKQWDLMNELFELYYRNVPTLHLIKFAEDGNIDGLRALRGVIKHLSSFECKKLVALATSNGHLEFLQELDAMGFLKEKYYKNIHVAITNGQIDCLEFLISRFGTKYLSYKDKDGYTPIYVAAMSNYPEALRAIIRLSPHYKFKPIYALDIALNHCKPTNAIILFESFPELIDYPNIIHKIVTYYERDVLKYLLENAKPETITAKDKEGDTALHCTVKCCLFHREKWVAITSMLMNTGLFNVMERNQAGLTAVAVIKKRNNSIPNPELMRIFKLETEEQFNEALMIRWNL